MPEGDTLQQARLRVLPVLEGFRLEYFWAKKLRGYRPRPGQEIEQVRVHGKNLLVDFDRGLTLRVHLGMGGYWRTSQLNESRTRGREPTLRLELSTAKGVARCYSAPGVETFVRSERAETNEAACEGRALTPLTNLGPDLAVDSRDRKRTVAVAVKRARLRCTPHDLMADVLLDQQVAAGIGNVYKSEVLFLAGIHPLTPLGLVSDSELSDAYSIGAELLFVHSQPGSAFRVTTPARPTISGAENRRRPMGGINRHYVYGRWRSPCYRCQSPIDRSYAGRLGRSSYWCPRCQRPRDLD